MSKLYKGGRRPKLKTERLSIVLSDHDELANYHGGEFVSWCNSIGYNPMQVKRYLDYRDFVLTNCENKALIESLPKSLVYEAGKKSAPSELQQKVLDGEITTHKQWQEERKKLEEEKRQAEVRLLPADVLQKLGYEVENKLEEV